METLGNLFPSLGLFFLDLRSTASMAGKNKPQRNERSDNLPSSVGRNLHFLEKKLVYIDVSEKKPR